MHLQTQNLTLRPLIKEDLPAFTAAAKAQQADLAKWMYHAPLYQNERDMQTILQHLTPTQTLFLGGFLNIPQTFALFITVNYGKEAYAHIATLGCWTTQEHQNQGLMKEALTVIIQHIFQTTNIQHIQYDSATENTASNALAKACGFMHEATLKNYYTTSKGDIHTINRYSVFK